MISVLLLTPCVRIVLTVLAVCISIAVQLPLSSSQTPSVSYHHDSGKSSGTSYLSVCTIYCRYLPSDYICLHSLTRAQYKNSHRYTVVFVCNCWPFQFKWSSIQNIGINFDCFLLFHFDVLIILLTIHFSQKVSRYFWQGTFQNSYLSWLFFFLVSRLILIWLILY